MGSMPLLRWKGQWMGQRRVLFRMPPFFGRRPQAQHATAQLFAAGWSYDPWRHRSVWLADCRAV